jgi:hypothetical protein
VSVLFLKNHTLRNFWREVLAYACRVTVWCSLIRRFVTLVRDLRRSLRTSPARSCFGISPYGIDKRGAATKPITSSKDTRVIHTSCEVTFSTALTPGLTSLYLLFPLGRCSP